MVNYEDFQKIELRVAEVVEASRIEGSEKLLRLLVNLGEEKQQIIAGIGKQYGPDDIAGKKIIIVANLEPRQLMGLESQGMLLAASDEDHGPVLLVPDSKEIRPGAHIK